MRITKIGTDFIVVNEDNLYDDKLLKIPRVHIIKLGFFNPSEEKIKKVLSLYPKTNRFVIDDNIRTYNGILKFTSKKYYIQNVQGSDLITFFRKNNKVLLDFLKLKPVEKQFLLLNCFEDVLRNLEVIVIDQEIFDGRKEVLELWNGNVIITDEDNLV